MRPWTRRSRRSRPSRDRHAGWSRRRIDLHRLHRISRRPCERVVKPVIAPKHLALDHEMGRAKSPSARASSSLSAIFASISGERAFSITDSGSLPSQQKRDAVVVHPRRAVFQEPPFVTGESVLPSPTLFVGHQRYAKVEQVGIAGIGRRRLGNAMPCIKARRSRSRHV